MIIVHISDLHLSKNTEADTTAYTVRPLVECIEKFNNQQKIDFVIFSGDLIDKGGDSYDKDSAQAFWRFYEIVILKLTESISLPVSNFLITPGNHDVKRSLDSIRIEKGILADLVDENKVNEFITEAIDKGDNEGFNRIKPYKDFESLIYSDYDRKLLTNFASNFIISVKDKLVGITCFNSAWRCYDSDKDKGSLLIGEYQINQSIDFIEACDIKIAVSHHTLDYLKEFDKRVVDARIQALYNIHFTGHVHRPDADYRIHSYGKLYRSTASGTLSDEIRTSSKEYENGFSIINYDIGKRIITNYFFRYDHLKNSFVPNNSLGDDNGVFTVNMLTESELSIKNDKDKVLLNIDTDNILRINSHLVTYQTDTKAPKTIDELFVMPIIESGVNIDPDREVETIKDVQELINSKKNYIVFGTKESGKTILMDKILIDQLKVNKSDSNIPIYIDFSESRYDIISLVKNFMGVNTKKAIELLEHYGVLLLVDNISFETSEKYKIKALNELLTKYPKSRFIGTHSQLYKDEIPVDTELSNIFEYDRLTIRSFKTKQIRSLIKKWFKDNDKYETPKKLQMMGAFQIVAGKS